MVSFIEAFYIPMFSQSYPLGSLRSVHHQRMLPSCIHRHTTLMSLHFFHQPVSTMLQFRLYGGKALPSGLSGVLKAAANIGSVIGQLSFGQ